MAAIFGDFRKFFAKNCKTQICFYLLRYPVRDRAISTKSLYLARLQEIEANLQSLPFLAKIFENPQKWPPFLGIFENILPKIAKDCICLDTP